MGTFEEVKQDLREAIGTIVYGVMAIHDYEPYEIMAVLRELMSEVEYTKDFLQSSEKTEAEA